MCTRWGLVTFALAGFLIPVAPLNGLAQTTASPSPTEIPIQHCDQLPVVVVRVDQQDRRFLVDTAATSFLNAKSFTGMATREVRVQSWNETANVKAREISIGELALGNHAIRDVKLPAIDLSAIAKSCGGQLDGVLGVDLLERLGMTINLKQSLARLETAPAERNSEPPVIASIEKAVQACAAAFNDADTESLGTCFDPEFVLTSPGGELHGREQATNYFRRGLRSSPRAHLSITMSDERAAGNLVWGLYDYTIDSASVHSSGQGIMLCRKSGDRWYILSMHEWPFVGAVNEKR